MQKGITNIDYTDESVKGYLFKKDKVDNIQQEDKSALSYKSGAPFKSKKLIAAVLLLFLATVSTAYFMYMKGQSSFDDSKVKVEIETKSEISSGEDITFNIKYKNGSNVKLKNPKLSFFVPRDFIFVSSDRKSTREPTVISWKLGDLPAGEFGKVRLFGRIIGRKYTEYEFASKISYTPENFNYEFESLEKLSKIKLKITSVPFEIYVKSPKSATVGDEISYSVEYKNIGKHNFKNIRIKAKFSEGFLQTFSQPEADEKKDNHLIWNIGSLNSNSKGKLTIKGKVQNNKDKKIKMEVSLYVLDSYNNFVKHTSKTVSVGVQEIPIVLSQTINSFDTYSANKGEELEYRIRFKNVSDKEIRGLVINSEIKGNIDFNTLQVSNGSYDNRYKITWSAFNVPTLAVLSPKEEDEVTFKIRVKDQIEINDADDKNFLIKNKATISKFDFDSDSSEFEKKIASNTSTVKINAFLFVRAKGYFNDDGRIANKGAIPPQVGKETFYTVHWNLGNLFNSSRDITVVSILPEWSKWTGNYIKPNGEISLGDSSNGTFDPDEEADNENKVIAEGLDDAKDNNNETNLDKDNQLTTEQIPVEKKAEEEFYYNVKTREIVWKIPRLEANTGTVYPPREVVFQISVMPESVDIGDVLKIMDKVEVSGYDEFTGEKITNIENELTTELPDDNSIRIEEGVVVSGN